MGPGCHVEYRHTEASLLFQPKPHLQTVTYIPPPPDQPLKRYNNNNNNKENVRWGRAGKGPSTTSISVVAFAVLLAEKAWSEVYILDPRQALSMSRLSKWMALSLTVVVMPSSADDASPSSAADEEAVVTCGASTTKYFPTRLFWKQTKQKKWDTDPSASLERKLYIYIYISFRSFSVLIYNFLFFYIIYIKRKK